MAGKSSYRLIHYVQRPAKNIERKMIASALSRLERLTRLHEMRYIGFGSIYFADFLLFHRQLGLSPMISIEQDATKEQRARFALNRPFEAVQLLHGHSNVILPGLEWSRPTVFWLDYDSPLDASMLSDVETVAFNTTFPSVLIVTVQAEPEGLQDGAGSRLRRFIERVGPDRVPTDIDSDRALAGWGTSDASWQVLDAAVRSAARDRFAPVSGGVPTGEGPSGSPGRDGPEASRWRQLFHFQYQDNARMLTMGGILHSEKMTADVNDCRFDNIDYLRSGSDACRIEVPQLTTREILHLDRLIPGAVPPPGHFVDGIPPSEVQAYADLYRYFPAFIDVDF